ncbi:LutC/YkgG family protein [Jatrophihabitans fulvus]
MSARDEILDRIRRAGAGMTVPPVPREYRGAGDGELPDGATDVVALFAERAGEYRAEVHRCAPSEVDTTVRTLLLQADVRRAVNPSGVTDLGVEQVPDDPPLGAHDLDGVDAVVTTCALAIALTGTVVLDHGAGQGRRALSLVPDRHVVIVRADQVVLGVPDAVAALDPQRPMTWISGPSATSDIELERVEGVHGPRTLQIVLVT